MTLTLSQLLMLSGVGPADHLKSLDIPVVADVPELGRNLYASLAPRTRTLPWDDTNVVIVDAITIAHTWSLK